MDFQKITEDNFLIYATKTYDTNHCESIDDFNSDLRRFTSVKRLLLKYNRSRENVKVRMLVNHVVVLSNLFGATPAAKLIFCFCPEETHSTIVSVFNFLGTMPSGLKEALTTESNQELDEDLRNMI